MKRREFGVLLILVIASFLFYTDTVFAATPVSGDITSDTTWTNQVYEVTDTTTVDPGVTLTIDPGAIVKFDAHTKLLVNGILNAAGTSGSGIVFTSVKDDSVGSDTNGDGTSTGASGDWSAIQVGTTGSTTLNNSIIRYGGYSGCCSFLASDVYNDGVLNVFNSEIASSTSYGIFNASGTSTIDSSDVHNNAYGIASAGGSINASSSTFHSNSYGIYDYGSGALSVTNNTFFDTITSGNPIFLDYSAGLIFTHSGNIASGTGDRGIAIQGSLAATQTWNSDGLPYEFSDSLTIPSGKTLTIDPSVIIKFDAHTSLLVNGTLDAVGTSGNDIIFTSVKDDSVGGDTNGDGTSIGAGGDWNAIELGANASTTIDHAVIRYGGYSGCCSFLASDIYNNGGILNVFNSEVASSTSYGIFNASGTSTVDSSDIHSNGYGIALAGGALNASHSTFHANSYGIYGYGAGAISVTHNTFFNTNTSGNPIFLDYSAGLIFDHSNNSAFGTGDRGIAVQGSLASSQPWSADGLPYEFSDSLTIPSGKTLTIGAGVAVKFDAHTKLLVNGTLDVAGNYGSGVAFTSIKDDFIVGDTNGDGTSTGAAGDWDAIEVGPNASTTLNYAIIRYGGYAGCCSFLASDVYNNGGILNVFNSEIASSTSYGIFNASGTSTIDGTEIYGNAYGYYYNGGDTASFSNNIIHDNYGYGMYNATTATTSAQNNYWGGNQGPYNAIYNPTGNGDNVSDYIDFLPYATTSVMVHYVVVALDPVCIVSNYCNSVHDMHLFLQPDATTTALYSSELSGAISTWNLGAVLIAPATTTTDMIVSANSFSDVFWRGVTSNNTIGAGTILLNTYYLNSGSSETENTITHELGHALGLAHSYTGNVMYQVHSAQTSLGPQDTADYHYLWP